MRRAAIRAICGIVMAVALGPAVARAGDIEEFETARAAYAAGDFARAVFYFEQLVGSDVPRLSTPALIVEARKYLGAAYLFVGRREAAREQFERLLRSQPDYVLDPLQFPAEVQELFVSVRERLALARREEEARTAIESRAERSEARARALEHFAEEEVRVEVAHSRWLALLPFGVGQFQNGDEPLGWLFLVSQAALSGVALGATIWHQDLAEQVARLGGDLSVSGVVQGNRLLEAAAIIDWIALASLGVMAIAGIVEAQARFVPSHTVSHQRRIPDALRDPDTATEARAPSIEVGAAQLTVRF